MGGTKDPSTFTSNEPNCASHEYVSVHEPDNKVRVNVLINVSQCLDIFLL